MDRTFPVGKWGATIARFYPQPQSKAGFDLSPIPIQFPITTALVFVFDRGCFVLANIAGRGWTIPGGRREPNEQPEQTAIREAYEETGVRIGAPAQIGAYVLSSDTKAGEAEQTRCVPVYVASVIDREQIPLGSESLGVQCVPLSELSEIYYFWDPLIEAVCNYAYSEYQRMVN